ncbi:MAG: NAD(P)H-binding protein [Actinomycetota bacterium]|nr:NAD(P)H-binding protein [Actinomycetota bacterium]
MSERNKILVTGATGSVGRNVVSELLGVNADVRAMVRTPETANLPDSVEVVRGDLCEPDTVAAALESTDAVFLLWAASDEFAPAAVAEISKHASRVVYLSSMGVRDDLETQKDPINQSHANLESLIEGSGLSWTFLRASGFASNTLGWADDVRGNGVVRAPYGEARRSLIHERDIAAVATRALTEEGHARKKHVITGSESVAQSEQARIIGEVVGCPVRWEEQSREEAARNSPPRSGANPSPTASSTHGRRWSNRPSLPRTRSRRSPDFAPARSGNGYPTTPMTSGESQKNAARQYENIRTKS